MRSMFAQDMQVIYLTAFVCLGFGVLVLAVASLLRRGLSCGSAFFLMWVLAYPVPTLIFLLSPETVRQVQGYAWMDLDQWCLAASFALAGLAAFGLGYRLARRRGRPNPVPYRELAASKLSLEWVLLALGLGLQLIPLYLIVSRGIAINFIHRAVHWQAVGLTIRFAYFALPTTAIAFSLFLAKRSVVRLAALAVTVVISLASAISLGARMFLVLIAIGVFLIFTYRKPKSRVALLGVLFAVVAFVAVSYVILLRAEGADGSQNSLYKVLVGDLGRANTLAYAAEHSSALNSTLVKPPLVGSYLYWAILPIPRSYWHGKPFATNLQFSFQFRAEHTDFYVPSDIADMIGTTEFGFIDEAMLNLGVAGLLIVGLWGSLAAWCDRSLRSTKYLRLAVPLLFLPGTIYSFNGIFDYFLPFLFVSLLVDLTLRRAQSRKGQLTLQAAPANVGPEG